MKLKLATCLLAITIPAQATGNAPFCVFRTGLQQCFYYSVESCQSAARTLGGMCSPNQNQDKQPAAVQLQHPDFVGAMREGQERGARERRAQEEHAARLRLIEAQTAAVGANARAEPAPTVTYTCQGSDGKAFTSQLPIIGCVVTAIDF